jgi:hypothetical protein
MPVPGCNKHAPTDPPDPSCPACKYLCRTCGCWDPSIRRWREDETLICICPTGAETTARRFWNPVAVRNALRQMK